MRNNVRARTSARSGPKSGRRGSLRSRRVASTAGSGSQAFWQGTGGAAGTAETLDQFGAALAVVFTLFYRYGVRIPLRPFFAVTSVILYYMAFVFAGKGIRELQEGNVVPITTLPGFPSIDAMGIYNTVETLLAQLLLAVLFVFAIVKTFWPSRSVALPSAPPSAVPVGDVTARLARLGADDDVHQCAPAGTAPAPISAPRRTLESA